MIAEDLLERGLADIAAGYDVPADAVDRIRGQLAPAVVADDEPTWWQRLHRPSKNGWMALAAASIVVLIIVAFAVGGSSNPSESAGGASAVTAAPRASAPAGFQKITDNPDARAALVAPSPAASPLESQKFSAAVPGSAGAGGGAANGPVTPVPTVPDRIVKTGELDLQVSKGQVGHTLDVLTGLATLERGYIADSRTSEGGFAPSGEVTLRVPVAAFDDTVKRARTIADVKVLSLQTSAKDVTSKYVDLTARISALKKTRETYLTLLTKANTIGETLAVQQHITDVQSQIEQLQGQKKVLGNQAALSTLTVTVDQKAAVAKVTPTHHKSGLHKAFDRSVSRFVHGIEAIIGIIGPVLLVLLIVGLGWLAARFGYRVFRRRMV